MRVEDAEMTINRKILFLLRAKDMQQRELLNPTWGQSQMKLVIVGKWGDQCHGNWQMEAPTTILKPG